MKEKKEQGLGVVGILVAVIVMMFVVGLLMWRFVDTSKTKPNQAATSQSGRQTQDGTQTNPTAYLDIKELGVKITLNDKTKSDTYAYTSTDPNGDGAFIFNEDMRQLDLKNQYCKDSQPGMIGMIQRSKDAYYFSSGAKAVVVDNNTAFKVGDYYFVFARPQAECSQDSAISQQRSSYAQDFIAVLKSIQADK